ncbi:MAG: helix-turn-helix transcriptional regulator [Planctomycetia bacterium]
MARNEQIVRQHRLLQVLEASRLGLSLDELTNRLVDDLGLGKLSPRTVRRDLEALQAAGFDLDSEPAPAGGSAVVWRMGDRLRKLPQVTASATELLALSVGRELLFPLEGTHFWLGIESFWTKLRESLPETAWNHFVEQRSWLSIKRGPVKSYAGKRGILTTVNRCIEQNRALEIEYQSAGKAPAVRYIEPYKVVLYQQGVYVVAAYSTKNEPTPADQNPEMRTLKLDRFLRADELDRRFQPRQEVDVDAIFANSLTLFRGTETARAFKIRFTAQVAAWVRETPWHPKQSEEMQTDGSLLLTIPSAYENEIIAKTLGLGTEAEILEPVDSRKRIAETLRRLLSHYGE